MKNRTIIRWPTAAFAAVWLAGATGVPAQTATPGAPAPAAAASGVKCFIWPVGSEDPKPREIRLISHREKDMLYRPADAPEGLSIGLKPSEVRHAEFMIELDDAAIGLCVFNRQWQAAAQNILTRVASTLPFLDLPGNDAFEPAMRAGVYLQRAADMTLKAGDTNSIAKAAPLFQAAKQIFDSLTKAQWNAEWECARLRSILCLIGQNKLEDAERELKIIQEPSSGDLPAGVFWLAHGRLRAARNDLDGALDASVKSVLFENKDIDTFPDALLLSARMYEARKEWHRARDVYYELARLFQGTDWGLIAFERLGAIMDKGLTSAKEQADVADVFFGVEEDMNKLAKDLLKAGPSGAVVDEKKPVEMKKDDKKDAK